jgi:acyl-CoA dehydrogenase
MSARIAGEDLVVSGTAVAVPWSEDAALVLTSVDVNGADAVALVPRADGHVTAGRDLGGQRRDAVVFNQATVRSGCWRVAENTADILLARAAAVGVVEMAAAAEVLQLTVGYAKEREQFGVPIASFQVVQHHLASLAGNVAALQAAAHLAVRALSEGDVRSAAAAKVVASESAGAAWRVAHQVHGAIGLTLEHSLHWWTHRLMAWRDEFGSERYWARWLGENVVGAGADAWAELIPA